MRLAKSISMNLSTSRSRPGTSAKLALSGRKKSNPRDFTQSDFGLRYRSSIALRSLGVPRYANGAISAPVLTPETTWNFGSACGPAGSSLQAISTPVANAPQSPPPETTRTSMQLFGSLARRSCVFLARNSMPARLPSTNRFLISVRSASSSCSGCTGRFCAHPGSVRALRVMANRAAVMFTEWRIGHKVYRNSHNTRSCRYLGTRAASRDLLTAPTIQLCLPTRRTVPRRLPLLPRPRRLPSLLSTQRR